MDKFTFCRGVPHYLIVISLMNIVISVPTTRASEQDPDPGALRDYCQFESFNATCPKGTTILIKTARYGRMRVGRCVRGDYGYIGCAASVLRNLDQRCSGESECRVEIPTLDEVAKPCPEDFKSHLEASYECVNVAGGDLRECRENHSIVLDKLQHGYVASYVTALTGFGSTSCPWTIRVTPGQRVKLRFYNFLPVTTESIDPRDDESSFGCPFFVVLSEKGRTVDVNLCDQMEREGHLYTSEGHELQLYFTSSVTTPSVPKFLLEYKAIGCPDIKLSTNAVVRRSGDNAIIKCNQTKETWYVTCKDNKWIGDLGNCTKGALGWRTGNLLGGSQPLPHGIVIAVVIGVLLGVVIGTILLAVVFTFRRYRIQSKASSTPANIETGRRTSHRPSHTEVSKDDYRFTRENHKDPRSTDYSYKQQTRPLIARPDGRLGDSDGRLPALPYSANWNTSSGNSIAHNSVIHEYESPQVTNFIPRDTRDQSLASPAPGDPPVYFELDPDGNAITTPSSGGVGTHGSLVALSSEIADDD